MRREISDQVRDYVETAAPAISLAEAAVSELHPVGQVDVVRAYVSAPGGSIDVVAGSGDRS